MPIFKEVGSELFFTLWDADTKTFYTQVTFKPEETNENQDDEKR